MGPELEDKDEWEYPGGHLVCDDCQNPGPDVAIIDPAIVDPAWVGLSGGEMKLCDECWRGRRRRWMYPK